MPKSSKACEACGSQLDTAFTAEVDRYGIPLVMAECQACGLRWLHNYWTPKTNREFYTSGRYRELVGLYRGKAFDWTQHRLDQWLYAAKLCNWLHALAPDRIVHVGADPHGEDPIAVTVAMRFGVPVESVANVEDWRPDARTSKPALALLCRTADHLLDLPGTLKKLHSYLEPEGYLYVDILTNHQIKIDHQYYLLPEHLKAMLDRAGYAILDSADEDDEIDDYHYSVLARCRS